jgi:hypothetical protein
MKGAGTGSGIARVFHPVVGKDLRFAIRDTLKNFVGNVFCGIRRVRTSSIVLPAIVDRRFPYRVFLKSWSG